ncbi:MAG: glycoside hydrolase family 3 N-terminal domain-containing protein [Terriglobia bacterium]
MLTLSSARTVLRHGLQKRLRVLAIAVALVISTGLPTVSSLLAGEDQLPYKNSKLPVEERITDLIGRMSLEEKVAQVVSIRFDVDLEDEHGNFSPQKAQKLLEQGMGSLSRPVYRKPPRQAAEFLNAVQRYLLENTRLGIPVLIWDEAVHGLMAYKATSFPQAIGLASTWDPGLVNEVFTAIADEMRSRGSNHALTPVLDLARDPRWGRTDETYGEDPYLVSRMGVAAIKGLQGRGPRIDRHHVMATAKHFAAHGTAGGLEMAPAIFSERELRENYLRPFQAAVTEAGVQSIMATYNEVNGIPINVNRWLLQKILRQEWGFQGLIVSDGGSVAQLYKIYHVAANNAQAARRALETGIEVELPDDECFRTLVQQVREGSIAESTLDKAVAGVLRSKFLLGLFDDPFVDPEYAERVNNSPEHQHLALKAAQKAIVLLKNEGDLLPLDPNSIRSIAVIGPNAGMVHLGGYSYDPGRGVTIVDGIRQKVGSRVKVNYAEGCRITKNAQGWKDWWIRSIEPGDPAEDTPLIAEAVRVARASDVALVVIGENEGTCRESAEHHLGDRDSLDLLGRQEELVRAVRGTGKPTIVLLINGRPISINSIAEQVPAILEGWYLGQETGTAVADVLFGTVNPGGKLPITFPRSVGQLPVYYNYKPGAKRGYLFTSAEPLFPFGHGLSYTVFQYDRLRVEPARIGIAGKARVSVQVTNAGKMAGDEVVQLYVHEQISSVPRPVKELKGFQRITLQPGETQTVQFQVTPEELSFLDEDMKRIVEPGWFEIMVGTSSAKLQTVVLEVIQN